ncbi:hypothetical protein F5141DRAFT_1201863 [Pisolithus sp. B1]|nr:hypothetical protein F5141DRAFT_1201863 [Pisolithus sp. B1]
MPRCGWLGCWQESWLFDALIRSHVAVYARGAKSELSSDFSAAFHLYLAAADKFLHISRSESLNPTFRARCKASAARALERAEKIKKASERPGAPFAIGIVPIDWFTQEQQHYILRRSSVINGIRYPMWTDAVPAAGLNALYIDPDGQPSVPQYAMSSTDSSPCFLRWNRPVTPMHPPLTSPTFSTAPVVSAPNVDLTPADIEQHLINDCSVCAMISVCVQHARMFNSKLLSSIYPGQQPGRYDIKVLINGTHRRISIDDALPFDSNGNPIGITTGVKDVLWPALLEKAYMKLMGGYDFPGSNSAIDLQYVRHQIAILLLTIAPLFLVWVHYPPATLLLQLLGPILRLPLVLLADGFPSLSTCTGCKLTKSCKALPFEKERTWTRLLSGFHKGHCVLTVGTDSRTTRRIKGLRLLPSHNYAVIDIRETVDDRWMTLLDSRVPDRSSLSMGEYESHALDMRWDDLCATFEGVYASWDPKLFHQELSFHGMWKPRNAEDREQSCIRHLRLLYSCTSSSSQSSHDTYPVSDNDVWVLLTRHLPDTQRTGEYIAVTVDAEDEWAGAGTSPESVPPLTGGRANAEAEIKGTYTTSTHVLVRTKVRASQTPRSQSQSSTSSLLSLSPIQRPTIPGSALSSSFSLSSVSPLSGALTVLACYDGPFDDVCFTVSVFCGSGLSIKWDENAGVGGIGVKGHSMKVEGAFTTKNSGGNHSYSTYMLNPQWHLRILEQETIRRAVSPAVGTSSSRATGMEQGLSESPKDKATVIMTAQGPRDVPLNLTAVWSTGERVIEIAQREVVATSGAYAYGYARAFANLSSGDYTIILSAFEPQVHLGAFTLKVESSRKFVLEPIPQEGAGMYARVTRGEWNMQSAGGSPSHGRYHLNPVYEVDIPSTAQFGARLHLTSGSPSASLNLSLFPAVDPFPSNRPLASSGSYSDALAGVDIPKRTLQAGKYWLVPSTWTAGVQAGFKLVVYCSDSGCVVRRRSEVRDPPDKGDSRKSFILFKVVRLGFAVGTVRKKWCCPLLPSGIVMHNKREGSMVFAFQVWHKSWDVKHTTAVPEVAINGTADRSVLVEQREIKPATWSIGVKPNSPVPLPRDMSEQQLSVWTRSGSAERVAFSIWSRFLQNAVVVKKRYHAPQFMVVPRSLNDGKTRHPMIGRDTVLVAGVIHTGLKGRCNLGILVKGCLAEVSALMYSGYDSSSSTG